MKKSKIVLVASTSLVSVAFASDLTNGLVGFFPFEGTPYDGMNHCYTVTTYGASTYERGAVGPTWPILETGDAGSEGLTSLTGPHRGLPLHPPAIKTPPEPRRARDSGPVVLT